MAITLHAVALIRSRRQKVYLSAFVMTEPRHEMLDYTSALALYMGGLAFRIFHTINMRTFLFYVSWDYLPPPNIKAYTTTLLLQVYADTCSSFTH